MKSCFLTTIFLLVLIGCQIGPRYIPPKIEVPSTWKNRIEGPSEVCLETILEYWWEVFEDPNLNGLELKALSDNPDLFASLARIEKASATLGIDRSYLFPEINFNPNFTDTGILFKLYTPSRLVLPGVDKALLKEPFRVHQMQYVLPLNLSYELDLWGKYRGKVDADFKTLEAKIDAYRAAQLALTAELASRYFNLRFRDAALKVLEKTIALREKNYNIAKTRYDQGLINASDFLSASVELATTKSDYDETLRLRGLEENSIAVLIGVPASQFSLPRNPLRDLPPLIPPDLPSTILLRRPDIGEAERNMASLHKEIGVAYASLFPSFSLTGTIGYLSPTFEDFLTGKSRYWSFGVDLFQTVFDAGRKCGNIEVAYANYHEARALYQKQVLTAFKEVEDALNNLTFQKQQAETLRESVEYAAKLYKFSMNRYQGGIANYIEVVTNERTALSTELNYVTVLGARYQATIELIKSLGGGWGLLQAPSEEPCGSCQCE